MGRGSRSGGCYCCSKIDIGLVVESSGDTPHDSRLPRQFSAAFKSRMRRHNSIPMRSPRSSAVSDTQACRDSSTQFRANHSVKATVSETVVKYIYLVVCLFIV